MLQKLVSIWRRLFEKKTANELRPPVSTEIEKFIVNYDKKYGTMHPNFHKGTYNEAVNEAKGELRLFVMYIHDETNLHTDRFCRFALGSGDVADLVDEMAIFWASSHSSPALKDFLNDVDVKEYPFIAVMFWDQNQLKLLGRQDGYCNKETLCQLFTDTFSAANPFLQVTLNERQCLEIDRNMKKQQEIDYAESLKVDQEKDRRKAEEVNVMRDKLRSEREKVENLQRKKLQVERMLPVEPSENENSPSGIVLIKIKFPSGAKIERRFYCTDNLQLLYNVAFCHPDCPEKFSILYDNGFSKLIHEPPGSGKPIPTLAETGFTKNTVFIIRDETEY